MSLGELEQVLLFALLHLGANASGAAVRGEIEQRTGRALSPGAMYTALHRLEQRGYVRSVLRAGTPQRGGHQRREYTLIPAGARALVDSYSRIQQMSDGAAPLLLDLAGEQS